MMPRNPLLASALGLAVVAGSLASGRSAMAQAGFGTIKGRLVWAGAELPNAPPKVVKGDAAVKNPEVCATDTIPNEDYVVDPATKGIANGFAYVVNPVGKNAEAERALVNATPDVVIDQKWCRFQPHAVALHKGQNLVFKSSDSVGHNIRYTGFTIGGFNEMLAANGSKLVTMPSAEKNPVEVRCDIHPWMNGYFMVFDHPFFTVTKPDGSFEITGVPAGAQRLIVRQESVGFVTPNARQGMPVDVKAGDVTDVGEIKLTPKKK
jgi:plastocyanin